MALILFDYDGVLVDSLSLEGIYLTEACRQMGISNLRNAEDLVKLSNGNFYAQCAEEGISIPLFHQALEQYEKTLVEKNLSVAPFPEMMGILAETARRFPVYIITSNDSNTVKETLALHQVEGIRDILGCDREHSKVKKIAAVKSLCPAEFTYYIGDTVGDVTEARESGVDVIAAVTWGWSSADALAAVNPDHLFHTVSELRDFLQDIAD